MMALVLLFLYGSPQILYIVITVSSLAWNHCCKIMIKKLLVLPFPAQELGAAMPWQAQAKPLPASLVFWPRFASSSPFTCAQFSCQEGCQHRSNISCLRHQNRPWKGLSHLPWTRFLHNLEGNFCH